jgi:hypothetical protein
MDDQESQSRTVFVVQRLHWEYQDNFFEVEDETPIKAFADSGDAAIYRDRQDTEARASWPVEFVRRGDTDAFFEVVEVSLAP